MTAAAMQMAEKNVWAYRVVARRAASPIREFSEEILDLMSLAIERLVARITDFSTSARWDTRFDALATSAWRNAALS